MSIKSKAKRDRKKKASQHTANKKREEKLRKQKMRESKEEAFNQSGQMIQKKIAEHQQKQAQYKENFGDVRQQITIDFQGRKLVAVGNKLYHSEKWKTFIDFLSDYIVQKLTPEWGNAEIAKPEEEKHQIVKIYQQLCRWQAEQKKDDDGIYRSDHTGVSAAYFQLAYDLYALDHHTALQEEVIRRLKVKDGYQGARYELMVAATFIRAGFDIAYEDETDKSKQHPEFVAVHKETGEKVSVEAKSRHREGILGKPGEPKEQEKVKAGINRILNNALKKPSDLPYIVCIDLNMPPIEGNVFESSVFKEIVNTIDKKERNYKEPGSFPATMYIFTNYPHHYANADELDPEKTWITTLVKKPKRPFLYEKTIHSITKALTQYGNIPNKFDQNT